MEKEKENENENEKEKEKEKEKEREKEKEKEKERKALDFLAHSQRVNGWMDGLIDLTECGRTLSFFHFSFFFSVPINRKWIEFCSSFPTSDRMDGLIDLTECGRT